MSNQEQGGGTGSLARIGKALLVLVFGGLLGYFVYSTTLNEESAYPFKFGLDLAGGSRLVYEVDTSGFEAAEVPELMNVLREVIERRINVFGVSEPVVQVERSSFAAEVQTDRLVVELPGVADAAAAAREIGKTPLLEFKLIDMARAQAQVIAEQSGAEVPELDFGNIYVDTGLTGRYLERAELVFGQSTGGGLSNESIVSITFNSEGAELFEQITRAHVGEQLAIFLDGVVMSSPRINEPISGGRATISGNFTPTEARELVRNLNFGALPAPVTLVGTQTIGSSLGAEALHAGVYAGVVGFILLIAYMIVWYRLSGIVASLALIMYVIIMLALFKFIPVVITAAGIAGFILSIGLAVDANILIAERMKEEFRAGKRTDVAIKDGFDRAWLAIRDSNFTHVIVGVILFWFGTALIKGFAFVFVLGVFVSMFSALTIARTLLLALPVTAESTVGAFLLGSGFSRK